MDREGFRNRLKQYRLAREENPGLKYWEWKAQPAEKEIPKYGGGTSNAGEWDPRITAEGYDDKGYYAQAMNPLPEVTVVGSKTRSRSERPIQYSYINGYPEAITWTTDYNPGAGALEIVSPEFEILTVAAGPIKKTTSKLLLNATNKIDDSLKYSGRFSQPSTNDKLYEIYNSKLANIGSFEDYKNYVATIFPDSKLKDVYYHGGAKNIKLFKDFGDAVTTSNVGAKHGIYFTPQKEYAQHTRAQRVLSVDADNKQRSIISSLKTRYTPGKLDKLIEDETELYAVLLNSLNPLITKGNWTWAINDKKYGELLEKGYDAVENKGQSLFLNINKLPETIVWDPLNVHILGSAEDIVGFEKYLNGYANGGEVTGPPTYEDWLKALLKNNLWMHPDYYMAHSLNTATKALKLASAKLPGREDMPPVPVPAEIKGEFPQEWVMNNLYNVENPRKKGVTKKYAKMYDSRTLGAGVDVVSGHPELYDKAKRFGIEKELADEIAYEHIVHDDQVIRDNYADIYGKAAADTLSFGPRFLVAQARYQLGNVRKGWDEIHKALAKGDAKALKKAVLKVTPEDHDYRKKWVKNFNVYGNEPE